MFYSGSNGELHIDGKKAARVANWSVSSSLALLDTTSLKDTDRTSTPGVRSTTGNCTLYYYAEDPADKSTNDASTLLGKLIKAKVAGESEGVGHEAEAVTLKLRLDDGTASGRHISGKAWLTSVQMSMAVGEVFSASCAFEFSGAPTQVTL
jgi:hypothetical protein